MDKLYRQDADERQIKVSGPIAVSAFWPSTQSDLGIGHTHL
jgi:hypothetical protein